MNAGEVCNREVIIVHRDRTIREAAELMRKYYVGDIVVVKERKGEKVTVGIPPSYMISRN